MRELTIEASVDNLSKVLAFLDEHLENAGCSMKSRMQIDLAVEELFVNIAHYAYGKGRGNATVCLEISRDPAEAVITFIDQGVAYNPLTKEDPDVSLPLGERQIGGLGIFISKKVMDHIAYKYKDGRNILRISKRL